MGACPRLMGWDGKCGVVMETCGFLSSSGGTTAASDPFLLPPAPRAPGASSVLRERVV